MNLKYVQGTYFNLKYVHLITVCTMYVLGTYWYILEEKSMYSYSVHTWGKKYVPGTYRLMLVYIGTIL